MAHPAVLRSIGPRRAVWPEGARARRVLLIAVAVLLPLGIVVAALGARAAFAPRSVAAQMFEDIRYAAVFTGRDPEATLRKAQQRVRLMERDFGMTRDQAAAYVARIMIEQSGGLCTGI